MLESGISAGDDGQLGEGRLHVEPVLEARASVNSAGTPSSSIRREVGALRRDGQPRHVEIVHAGGVAATTSTYPRSAARPALPDLPILIAAGVTIQVPNHFSNAAGSNFPSTIPMP